MDYMGTSDNDKRAWMNNFVEKLSAPGGLGVYMITSADLAAISAAVADFAAALTVVQSSTGRNPGTTALKNDLRAAAQGICRQYARLIKWNAGIDDQAKIDAGIKPPVFGGEPRPCPLTAPGLSIVAATNGAQTLQYNDPLDPTARRKPLGADGIVLFRAIATAAATDIEQATFYRKYTTSPMPVFFDGPDRGKIATYFGRWIGQRGDMSTPSAPVSMAIAA
jgi:hypothetical protein